MSVSEWYQAKNGQAEHLVYLDSKAKELTKLLNNEKSMIIRGGAGRKVPLGGRAKVADTIYFVETGGDLIVGYRGVIKRIIETEKLTPEESVAFVDYYGKELNLSPAQYKRWAGKKFLAIFEIAQIEAITPFIYRRDKNMDDWIITDKIESIKA